MTKKRLVYLGLLIAAVGIFLVMSRVWPREQTIHVILGEAAPRVEEVELSFIPAGAAEDDDSRARRISLHYPAHDAPQAITQAPKLANGDWLIELAVMVPGDSIVVHRRLKLEGGVVTLDVAHQVPTARSPEAAPSASRPAPGVRPAADAAPAE